ncbi:hypothetical protein AX15_003610 [Amanita polypyramis BW_CC]|nr:hypothetical protein AX15_003610 [Amanita polypyramis BW_CC]
MINFIAGSYLVHSASLVDFLLDAQLILAPFVVPVILPASPNPKIRVHTGFLISWCSIAPEVIELLIAQAHSHPHYDLVTVGHSLGGALATLAAVSLKLKFPDHKVRTYSYGSPRVGNKEFADFINTNFGKDAFRVVHTSDGVPTIIPKSLGYHHHGMWYRFADFLNLSILKESSIGKPMILRLLLPQYNVQLVVKIKLVLRLFHPRASPLRMLFIWGSSLLRPFVSSDLIGLLIKC